MSELVDRVITALRAEHDSLVRLVSNLDAERLRGPSGADEWTVAQVLSHLGSGAEIGRAPIVRATGGSVETEENRAIWARWDAAGAADQAAGFVEYNTRWLETVEALTAEQRSSTRVDLGFLPEPVPVVTALGMRLNEVANHSWDVRVALDPAPEVAADSATALVDLFRGPLGFMLGRLARERPSQDVTLAVPSAEATLLLGETVGLAPDAPSPSATFDGPAGAFVRLLNRRLKDPYDAGVRVEGAVDLDDLRRVFPGF